MRTSRKYALLLLIVLIGLLFRFVYLKEIQESPFFSAPFGDGEYFDTWGKSIANGNIVGDEVFFKAPLYAYVIGFFYWSFGHNFFLPRFLNVLFDLISVVLLFFIGKKLWNPTVGLISAAMAACGGIFIYFSGEILGTSLAVMLGLAVVNLVLYGGKRFSRWFFAGVVLSLLVLVRPNGLLLLPAALLVLALKKEAIRWKIKSTVLFIAGLLLLPGMTGIRNYAVGKDIVLINYSGGVNFYIGNNIDSDGISAVLPGYGNDWDEYSIAEVAVGRELRPSEASRYWMLKGFRYIVTNPLHFSQLMFKKSYLLLNGKEISNNQNIYRFTRNSYLLRWLLFLYGTRFFFVAFPSSILIALGISGIILSLAAEKRRFLLLYLFALFFGVSVVAFFVSSRYRMPCIAFLIPFSAFSLYSLCSALRRKERIKLWLFSFLPFLVLASVDPYGVSMENEALESYNLGNAYYRKDEYEKAKICYERAIKGNPRFPRVHLNLGAIYFKEGRYGEAEKAYLYEIEINPRDSRAYHNLALLYEQEGRIQDAIEFEHQAVERAPRFAEAQRSLGRLLVKVFEYDSAVVHLERAYRLHMRDSRTLSLLGLSHLRLNRFDVSIKFLLEARGSGTADPYLEYNIAVAYIGLGELEHAKEHLLQSLEMKQDFAEAHFNLGMIYRELGDEKNAQIHFSEALRFRPDFDEAKKMIEKGQ